LDAFDILYIGEALGDRLGAAEAPGVGLLAADRQRRRAHPAPAGRDPVDVEWARAAAGDRIGLPLKAVGRVPRGVPTEVAQPIVAEPWIAALAPLHQIVERGVRPKRALLCSAPAPIEEI